MLTPSIDSGVPRLKALSLVIGPIAEPVSTTQVKSHIRQIMGSSEDGLIASLIISTRQKIEAYTHRALITQTWDAVYDTIPGVRVIDIALPTLKSITSITTYDKDDASTVFASSKYFVDVFSEPGRVSLNDGESWPTGSFRIVNAMIIRFIAGYGNATAVPDAIKQAMLQAISFFYKNREGVREGQEIKGLPQIAKDLLSTYRIVRL